MQRCGLDRSCFIRVIRLCVWCARPNTTKKQELPLLVINDGHIRDARFFFKLNKHYILLELYTKVVNNWIIFSIIQSVGHLDIEWGFWSLELYTKFVNNRITFQ